MRLVVVTARERYVRPINCGGALDRFQHALETLHATKELGRQANLSLEQVDKAPRAKSYSLRYIPHCMAVSRAMKRLKSKLHRGVPVEPATSSFQQSTLKDTQFGFGLGSG